MGAHCQYPEGLSLSGLYRRLSSRIWDSSFERGTLFMHDFDSGSSLFFTGRISSDELGVLKRCDSSSVHYNGVPVSEDSFGETCQNLASFIRRTEGVFGVQSLVQQAVLSFSSVSSGIVDVSGEEYVSGVLHALHFRARDFLSVDVDDSLNSIVERVRTLRCHERIGVGVEILGLESSMHNIKIVKGTVLSPAFTPLEYYQTGDVEGCTFLEKLDMYVKKYS